MPARAPWYVGCSLLCVTDPRRSLVEYAERRFGARPSEVQPLGTDGGVKELGYGAPVRLVFGDGGPPDVVVHRLRSGGYGHETLADHAAEAFFAWDTFSRLPGHARALDVGVVSGEGQLVSLADTRDLFYVTEFVEGRPYFHDLDEIAARGSLTARDVERIDHLARYLASIHRDRRDAPELYLRRVRELFGHHECLSGLLDSYDAFDTEAYAPKAFLEDLERRAVAQRHRLKRRVHRLAVVHGDFHPWNILFDDAGVLHLLDRSRGELGEPADDLAALAINPLFFALRAHGSFTAGLRALWDRLFATYLAETGDHEVLEALPPFLVFRALVVASPAWYPHVDVEVRRALFCFVDRAIGAERLDPSTVERWLEGP